MTQSYNVLFRRIFRGWYFAPVLNPEKRLGRFYKNQAFQKVQKRNVHEKR